MANARAPTRLSYFLIREATVMTVIVVNALALFFNAFPAIRSATHGVLDWVDYGCLVFFILEAALKIRTAGFPVYWRSGWNKIDFVIVVAGLPLLISPFITAELGDLSIVLLLRMGRVLRFSRMMRFVPNASEIWRGILRALKASVAVFLVLFVLNLILAMGANVLFSKLAPTYFGDPLVSLYSIFKVFTVEGWHEIPDTIAQQSGSEGWGLVVRAYFVFAVLVGGILGLSLANAIFVDEMIADNNNTLEGMVTDLRAELAEFREEMRQARAKGR